MTIQDYLFDFQIQNDYPPSLVVLPHHNQIYNIDLESRTIEAPKFLSVATDHRAEVVYFKVNRIFDYIDLSNTVCLIYYTVGTETHIYPVPFYDIQTLHKEGKMIIPWSIDGNVTKYAGDVKYSMRFYRINKHEDTYQLVYNLNTLPSVSKVLYGGMDTNPDNIPGTIIDTTTTEYENLIAEVSKLQNRDLRWKELY